MPYQRFKIYNNGFTCVSQCLLLGCTIYMQAFEPWRIGMITALVGFDHNIDCYLNFWGHHRIPVLMA